MTVVALVLTALGAFGAGCWRGYRYAARAFHRAASRAHP